MFKLLAAFSFIMWLLFCAYIYMRDPSVSKRDTIIFLLKVTGFAVASVSILGLIVFLF
jgi:hypothetical protein